MMAAGIPTYSIDFMRLCDENKRVIARYNRWYNDNLDSFMRGRIPLDGEHDLFRIDDRNRDIFFLVNSGGNVPVTRDAVIFNGTFKRDLFLYSSSPVTAEMNSTDCSGRNVCRKRLSIEGWQHVETAPCGMVTIENLRTV